MPGRMELKNKRVLVVGLARTGVATALFCAGRGAAVTGTDSRNQAEVGEEITAKLRAANVNLELGGHQEQTFYRASSSASLARMVRPRRLRWLSTFCGPLRFPPFSPVTSALR